MKSRFFVALAFASVSAPLVASPSASGPPLQTTSDELRVFSPTVKEGQRCQPPRHNGIPCLYVTGVGSGCCDGQISESDNGGCGGWGGLTSSGGAAGGTFTFPGSTPSVPDGVMMNSVLFHTGQEIRDETDLSFPGVDHGVDLDIMRRHQTRFASRDRDLLHGTAFHPMFGRAWAFNLQRTLWWDVPNPAAQSEEPHRIYEEGFERVDVYEQVPRASELGGYTKVWHGTRDVLDSVVWNPAGTAEPRIVRTGGVELRFSAFENAGLNDDRMVARIESIVSPNGNQISFTYGPGGTPSDPSWHRIESLEDSYERVITFFYSDTDSDPSNNLLDPSLVRLIRDFDGREIHYTYDSDTAPSGLGLLETCLTPETTDTPNGRMTEYQYDLAQTANDPRLTYNLTGIVFPNEVAEYGAGNGPTRLSWTYYGGSGLEAGRVHTHTIGNTSTTVPASKTAGGTTTFAYDPATGVTPAQLADPDTDVNASIIDVTMTTSRGHVVLLSYNQLGQLRREEVVVGDVDRGFMPSDTVRTFTLDSTGLLIGSTGRRGDSVSAQFESGLAAGWNAHHRASDGHRHTITHTPGDRLIPAMYPSLDVHVVYEPVFSKPFKVTDERGFTTTYIYDYMEDLDATVPLLEERFGFDNDEEFGTHLLMPTATFLSDLLADRGITSLGLDVNGDGRTDDTCGNLIKIIYNDVTLPNEASILSLGTTQQASETFKYNTKGQPISHTDAEGNVHLSSYYPTASYSGNMKAATGPSSLAPEGVGGYLRTVILDTSNDADRNSASGYKPINSSQAFIYRLATPGDPGQGAEYTRSTPTTTIDSRRVEHDVVINAQDEVSASYRAARSGTAGLAALNYATLLSYDHNGNVVSATVDEDDGGGTAIGQAQTVLSWTYDILDDVKGEIADVGGLNLTETYLYDSARNLIEMREIDNAAPANDKASPRTTWAYDERNILKSTTRGTGAPSESKTSNEIDTNGNVVRLLDASDSANDPDMDVEDVLIETDGYDRVVKVTARDLTVTEFQYDKAGNLTREWSTGAIHLLDAAGSQTPGAQSTLLAEMRSMYDERNRPYEMHSVHQHFMNLGNGQTTLDHGALSASNNVIDAVSHVLVLDKLGRIVIDVDSDADATKVLYDGLGRGRKVTDALENYTRNDFDSNSNLTRVVEFEKPSIASLTFTESFSYSATYDAVNRPVTVAEPNRQVTRFEYDPRSNLRKRIDALSNEVEYKYDPARRLRRTLQFLSATGESASAANVDTGQGGGDGIITIEQSWDDLSRLNTRTDDRGSKTSHLYDALHRVSTKIYGDKTQERFFYNADDELLLKLDQAGVLVNYLHDVEGRVLAADYALPVGPSAPEFEIVGTEKQAWSYDGLGRNWALYDDNGAGTHNDALVEFHFDSLGRVIQEDQTLGGVTGPNPTILHYEGANRVVEERYPNGRRIGRGYDALDRLARVWEPDSPALPDIMQRDYIGRGRVLRQEYRNDTVLSKLNATETKTIGGTGGYDVNGRTVRHEWGKLNGTEVGQNPAGAQITGYVSSYNGMNGVGTSRRDSETREHLGATGRTDNYTFDSAYRMLSFDRETHNATGAMSLLSTRVLDGVDKMTTFIDEGVDRMPKVDMHPVQSQNGLNQYSELEMTGRDYDANGGLQSGYNGLTLRYDALKRLRTATPVMGLGTEYAYDAIGRRLAKFGGGNVPVLMERFYYDGGWRVLEERDVNGAVTKQFVDGSGIDEHLQYRVIDGSTETDFYYHCNAQGFVGALTDGITGAVVEQYEYRWLGTPVALDVNDTPLADDVITDDIDESVSGLFGNPYSFQGRRLDTETGLYHFRHRQYDAATGSFTSIDPSGLWRHGQGNGYSAFDGDGWNVLDPSGLLGGHDPDDPRFKNSQSAYLKESPRSKELRQYREDAHWMANRSKAQSSWWTGGGRDSFRHFIAVSGFSGDAAAGWSLLGKMVGNFTLVIIYALPVPRVLRCFEIFKYGFPAHGRGYGINFLWRGKRLFGLHWHPFKLKNPGMPKGHQRPWVNKPHWHRRKGGSKRQWDKHRPWDKRGPKIK